MPKEGRNKIEIPFWFDKSIFLKNGLEGEVPSISQIVWDKMVTDLPRLTDEVESLKAERDELRAALKEMMEGLHSAKGQEVTYVWHTFLVLYDKHNHLIED